MRNPARECPAAWQRDALVLALLTIFGRDEADFLLLDEFDYALFVRVVGRRLWERREVGG